MHESCCCGQKMQPSIPAIYMRVGVLKWVPCSIDIMEACLQKQPPLYFMLQSLNFTGFFDICLSVMVCYVMRFFSYWHMPYTFQNQTRFSKEIPLSTRLMGVSLFSLWSMYFSIVPVIKQQKLKKLESAHYVAVRFKSTIFNHLYPTGIFLKY
jgi:hypothetical protein